jgi:hypothetical protein
MNELGDPMMALLIARLLDGNVAAEELGLLTVSGTAVPPFGKFDSTLEVNEYGHLKPLENTYEVEAPGAGSGATRVLVKAEKDFADFVLRSHFLRASVEARDPWLASLCLWLLKMPIFSTAVLLTGQTAVVYPLVPPMPGKPKVALPAKLCDVAVAGLVSVDPELVQFARFLLDRPQIKDNIVIRGVVQKVGPPYAPCSSAG